MHFYYAGYVEGDRARTNSLRLSLIKAPKTKTPLYSPEMAISGEDLSAAINVWFPSGRVGDRYFCIRFAISKYKLIQRVHTNICCHYSLFPLRVVKK